MLKKLFSYLNPLSRLGNRRYSIFFPLVATLLLCVLSEIYAYGIAKNPLIVGEYIIFLNAACIIYFSFRDGVIGGVTSSIVTIVYYFYIIATRHFYGQQLVSGIDTTISLAIIYVFISAVIGFLRISLDKLIEKEAHARIRLETILEQLPVGVIITSPKGKVEFINKKIDELFDNSVEVGARVADNFARVKNTDNTPVKQVDAPSVQVLKTGKPSKIREFIFTGKEGERVFTRSSAVPIKNNKGQMIAIASITSDITVEKEQEERKDDFIKMASHELKTPLTSAKVFTQVLEKKIREKGDKEFKGLIERLNGQIDKLTILVGDLLDVTRFQKGTLKVKKEKFLVRPLAEDVVRDLQPISKHNLIMRWTTRLPVFGDKERIRQVLTNLIANAIKYSPETSDIIIGSRKNEDCIEVYVKDFGQGISKSEQKKIFNRFYQVAENYTYPGLGLGLYISNEIIKQHNGKMWVESEKGKGSIFWFSLPGYKK